MDQDHPDILARLRQEMPYLTQRYHLATMDLFGSTVRGEEHPGSDLDLLVTFRTPPSLFQFVEMENYLTDRLGVKVDLVLASALKPGIGQRIRAEARRI
ncbi:MAG: nucleotidyltransferase family protein [Thermodesulfobacteriota bacterium]